MPPVLDCDSKKRGKHPTSMVEVFYTGLWVYCEAESVAVATHIEVINPIVLSEWGDFTRCFIFDVRSHCGRIVDLGRTWWSILPASDASTSYGFGLCVAAI